jgi:hypothetical protein
MPIKRGITFVMTLPQFIVASSTLKFALASPLAVMEMLL